MRILALEPYYSGSHRAFLDGWSSGSRHEWDLCTLPGYKWKWRMRHAPLTMAEWVRHKASLGSRWAVLFCSDMLPLAEFRGLVGEPLASLPAIVYFHENQLTYPAARNAERDHHFAMTNIVTAAAAEQVWFNSDFHRREFVTAARELIRRMPDYQPLSWIDRIESKASVQPPGVDARPREGNRKSSPLHVLWAARWEHDKNPEDFFEALRRLKAKQVFFRLSVIGEQFAQSPPVFARAAEEFRDSIACWGYQHDRAQYEAVLHDADVYVSTADHEFFGITAVEAAASGAYPLLPRRLAYPEVFAGPGADRFFYENSVESLVEALLHLAHRLDATGSVWERDPRSGIEVVARYGWQQRRNELDAALARLTGDANTH